MSTHTATATRNTGFDYYLTIQEITMNTDSLVKAIALAGFASANLAKSHVKEHERHSASGAVSQVRAYDDKRQAAHEASSNAERHHRNAYANGANVLDIRDAAKKHANAAHDHIEAANSATSNKDIDHHLAQANLHLSKHSALNNDARKGRQFQNSNEATVNADAVSAHAYNASHPNGKQADMDTSQKLNRTSALHLLAMTEHQKAEASAKELANEGPAHMKEAALAHVQHHRDMAVKHGAEVQRIVGTSLKARDAAYAASAKADKSNMVGDHEAAAAAHRHAAKLDYDPETADEHSQKATEHTVKAWDLSDKDDNRGERMHGAPAQKTHDETTRIKTFQPHRPRRV
jgi:hypothetical protein